MQKGSSARNSALISRQLSCCWCCLLTFADLMTHRRKDAAPNKISVLPKHPKLSCASQHLLQHNPLEKMTTGDTYSSSKLLNKSPDNNSFKAWSAVPRSL